MARILNVRLFNVVGVGLRPLLATQVMVLFSEVGIHFAGDWRHTPDEIADRGPFPLDHAGLAFHVADAKGVTHGAGHDLQLFLVLD